MLNNQIKNTMTTTNIKLSETEIEEQKVAAQKYLNLINRELSFGEHVNLDNVATYTKAYKIHSALVENPFIEMPSFN